MTNSVVSNEFPDPVDVDLAEILLLFRGRILNDDQTISSCNIASEDTILLVVRQRSEPGMCRSCGWIVRATYTTSTKPYYSV